MFLRNCWYIAARSQDVNQGLVARTMLMENVVLFRRKDGTVAVLEDACPHRKLPLSKGRLLGDIVECGYHGLQFDCSGTCVVAPSQDRIPPTARVRVYPALEKWGFVWVWMGESEKADKSKLYKIENYENTDWGFTEGGMLEIDCHYLWLTDNLLDPTHVAYVHQSSFAASGTGDTPLEIETFSDGVVVSRWILDQEPPPYYAPRVKFEGNCDRLQHYEVRIPSICINRSIFTPTGSGGDMQQLDEKAYVMVSYNFMTPVDENRTTYYWFQHYNTDPEDTAIAKQLNEGAKIAFNEDREVLEAVHIGMSRKITPNINLGLDAGSLHYRRMLDKAISEEQAD